VTSSCVWRVTPEVIQALEDRLGEPVDAYVNGSQTWLRDDGPGEVAVEWRLHPVAGFRQPPAVESHHELFAAVAFALAAGEAPPAPLEQLWDGLEVFPAYGDEIEPVPLAEAGAAVLGIAPDAFGLVDHDAIGDAWERSGGTVSVTEHLLDQLRAPGSGSDVTHRDAN
jgi:hypothetical protein